MGSRKSVIAYDRGVPKPSRNTSGVGNLRVAFDLNADAVAINLVKEMATDCLCSLANENMNARVSSSAG
jgi:hypothetical protein